MTVRVHWPLPVSPEEMRENEHFYHGAARRVVAAARKLVDDGQGWGDRKAFISDVAREVGTPVRRLAPMLIAWNNLGWVELNRADLVAAMDPEKVAASHIDDGHGEFHFIVPPTRGNPALNPPEVEEAADLYRQFHRYDPKWVGTFAESFQIPAHVRCLGAATSVLYRSQKVDPETLRRPKRPQNYIHDHEGGVFTYAPVELPGVGGVADTDVPEWICHASSLVLLGECLGFSFTLLEDDACEVEPQVVAPLPELYAIPSGRALLIIEDKRQVAAIIWGGELGVEARGIVG